MVVDWVVLHEVVGRALTMVCGACCHGGDDVVGSVVAMGWWDVLWRWGGGACGGDGLLGLQWWWMGWCCMRW